MAHVMPRFGSKINGRHTIIRYARSFLQRIDNWAEGNIRIHPGLITAGRAKGGLKVWNIRGGLRVKLYNTAEAQEFFLYTHNTMRVREWLYTEFPSCEFVT